MTSPLDEISFKLGEVSAGLAVLANRFDAQDRKLTDLGASVADIKNHIEPVVDDLKWMKPQVRSYQQVRKHAVWFGGLIVAVFGAVGGTLSDWLFKKYVG